MNTFLSLTFSGRAFLNVFLLFTIPLAVIFSSGCTRVIYKTVPLAQPELLYIPKLTNNELSCVSDDTYRRISVLDMNSKHNIKLLQAVIGVTHEQ